MLIVLLLTRYFRRGNPKLHDLVQLEVTSNIDICLIYNKASNTAVSKIR